MKVLTKENEMTTNNLFNQNPVGTYFISIRDGIYEVSDKYQVIELFDCRDDAKQYASSLNDALDDAKRNF